jgi:hypothetical protein
MPGPVSTASGFSRDGLRMLAAIGNLPQEEREEFDLVRIQAGATGSRSPGKSPLAEDRSMRLRRYSAS